MSTTAFASAGMLSTMGEMQNATAATADTSGYKALVCVFLFGGNSSFNWLVPTSSAGYSTYAQSRSNLALSQSSLLPLNGAASDGFSYGLHPSCPEIQTLFNAGNATFICNVGTLVRPATVAQAKAGSVALPPQLFSHIDQQTLWQTSIADSAERYGWAGRVADLYYSQGVRSNLALNINVGTANYWQDGRVTIPYVLGTAGAPTLDILNNTGYRAGARRQASIDLLNQAKVDSNPFVKEYAAVRTNAIGKVSLVQNAFNSIGDLATPFPPFLGDSDLGAQLHMVARTIKARSQFADGRQIFFVSMGGYDTHNGELATQASLLQILSKNLSSFWDAMGEVGMQSNVTLFTASDFGRSLGSNGDGSDHGWGGHSLVLGGAVQGGRYYGTMPSLAINGANDLGNGRIVPTTSTDQVAATLTRWFGVADADLDSLFPNLPNFSSRNLGFLG
ncbi:MAG: DUF1501 domain-containing protein [Steroidobacteraceae bacterium]